MTTTIFDFHVTIVVPVYNGSQTIRTLVEETLAEAAPRMRRLDFVLVNDGSADASWEALQDLAQRHPEVTAIDLTRNSGQHAALLCGFKHAAGDVIVTMDDDLQHPPSEIPKLLAGIAAGNDVVYGLPEREVHGFWRDLSSLISKFAFQKILDMRGARDTSAFRAIRAHVVAPFRDYSAPFMDVDGMLTWTTTRFSAVTTLHLERRAGRSNYTFLKLLNHALNMIVSYTTVPLRLVSLTGFVFTLFGFGVLAYVLGRYLIYGAAVPGFAFLACMSAVLSGAQLFALGILGEYFAKVHFRMMGRPGAIPRAVVRGASGAPALNPIPNPIPPVPTTIRTESAG